ncbi:hypothetical protein B0T22DRAFT_479400 [Podospora appendiculata]|uniref:Uncharacterized protein n=1 Tax=Podospora appendiculata TaxID=314037 RepID=A0AAE1CC34_9PEZI|nr:hypothetical protein B0T22DRAFT_479400 [Podospora appendiculata]
MSLLQSYRGLSFKTRLGVGAGLILWGVIGLKLADTAEDKLGYTPTEADKAALDRMTPKVQVIDRRDNSSR